MKERERYFVTGLGELHEAIALHRRDPEHSKRLLAYVMRQQGNAINAVAHVFDYIEDRIDEVHRAREVRALMLEYLKAQGVEGEHLERMRAKARDEARSEAARRQRERAALEESFLRGPAHYANMRKIIEGDRKMRAS